MAATTVKGPATFSAAETLRIFKKALDEGGCPRGGGEDTFIEKCLKSQGAKPVSITRD